MKANLLLSAVVTLAFALSLHPRAEGAPQLSVDAKPEIELKVLLIIQERPHSSQK